MNHIFNKWFYIWIEIDRNMSNSVSIIFILQRTKSTLYARTCVCVRYVHSSSYAYKCQISVKFWFQIASNKSGLIQFTIWYEWIILMIFLDWAHTVCVCIILTCFLCFSVDFFFVCEPPFPVCHTEIFALYPFMMDWKSFSICLLSALCCLVNKLIRFTFRLMDSKWMLQ